MGDQPIQPDTLHQPSPGGRLGWVPYLALCAVGLTLALTWLGPRAGDGLGIPAAAAFWAAHVFPMLALLAVTQIALSRIARVASLPGLAQVLLSAVVASVLFAPLALAIDAYFQADGSVDDATDPFLLRAASELANFVIPLVLTWVLINAPSLLRVEARGTEGPEAPSAPPTEPSQSAEEAEFWSRVPGRLGRDLIALSAELHYLRVYTTLGETLILFPFGRAVDAMSAKNGLQIHRSHWVSLEHVDETVTKEGRVFCRMIKGPTLPVSRSYRSKLKSALRLSA